MLGECSTIELHRLFFFLTLDYSVAQVGLEFGIFLPSQQLEQALLQWPFKVYSQSCATVTTV